MHLLLDLHHYLAMPPPITLQPTQGSLLLSSNLRHSSWVFLFTASPNLSASPKVVWKVEHVYFDGTLKTYLPTLM